MSSLFDEINKNRNLFLRFNEIKYSRFQLLMANNAIRRVINAIPILLSINNKKLPGYIEGDVPCGIADFKPDEEAMNLEQSLDGYCVIVAPEPFRKFYKEIEQTFKEAYEFITPKDR